MSWGDTLHYYTVGNPVSNAVFSSAWWALKSVGTVSNKIAQATSYNPKPITMWELTDKSYCFIRLAGLSGASAVMMEAYGKYSLANIPDPKDQMEAKAVFDTANRFHFLHSFALLAMPLVRRPTLTGSLIVSGCILFCGPLYYRALSGDKSLTAIAACGGFCLIAAWSSLIF